MKKLGFGCMRLKMNGNEVDYPEFSAMIAKFFDAGFHYFDTAHGYIAEKSEIALRECLTSKYPREKYILTDKMSQNYIKEPEDVRPYFETQLRCCGVEYFDYYLLHAINRNNYDLFKHCNAFAQALELKAEGKIRHLGMSFHDTAEFLEMVLTEHPEIEVVQLQFNYLDYDDPNVQSFACYQVCEKFGKKVIVMEPVKGGSLADLPEAGRAVLDQLGGGSYASYAIRFAASFPNVFMVLSGMSNRAQMEDNLSYMKEFVPFSEKEYEAVSMVRSVIRSIEQIPCTACKYCVEGCPMSIPIPDVFKVYNRKNRFAGLDYKTEYASAVEGKGMASACVSCGQCEDVCPQHLPIRELLVKCAEVME